MDLQRHFPCTLNCGHVVCVPCRDQLIFKDASIRLNQSLNPNAKPVEKSPNKKSLTCSTCSTWQEVDVIQMNSMIEVIRKMSVSDECMSIRSTSTVGLGKSSSMFRCAAHEHKKIKYFNHADHKFICSICQFDEKVTKDIAF